MKIPSTILLFLFADLFFSCQKFFEVPPPAGSSTGQQVFRDENSLRSAVAGLYEEMQALGLSLTNGGATVYGSLSADELVPSVPSATIHAFFRNTILPDNAIIQADLWAPAYKIIYQANAILEGIESSTGLSEAAKRQARGEALLVRALHYFYLCSFFGDVPFVTTTNYTISSSLPRTSLHLIFNRLKEDLIHAKAWIGALPVQGSGRASTFAAAALLARIYLYTGEWQRAETEASEVIQPAIFQLEADPAQTFLKQSHETIWQLTADDKINSEAFCFVPVQPGLQPPYALSQPLLAGFESGDKRSMAWTKTIHVNNLPYTYPYKYRSSTPSSSGNYIVFRLSEQYLIRAEARTRLNNIAESLVDLNLIRLRAGLVPLVCNDTPSLLTAIEQERRIEFFCEWGHRWLDLKRWGKADAILSPVKGNDWQSTDQLYPIPWQQIQINPALTQNPGY